MLDRLSVFAAMFALLIATGFLTSGSSNAGTLDTIRKKGEIKIGYRKDAAPYSHRLPDGKPAGYTIDLCQAVVGRLKRQLRLGSLKSRFVPVTAKTRFDAVRQGRVHLLCGATTITLGRRKVVDFSIPVFADGAGVMYRSGGPSSFPDLAGHKIGVVSGTTTEVLLRRSLGIFEIRADVVSVPNHHVAMTMIKSGSLAAYFADRGILHYLVGKLADPSGLVVSDRFLSYEPYGLALHRGDSDFRLAIDTALSSIYRTPEINVIFKRHFKRKPGPSLKALLLTNALPD